MKKPSKSKVEEAILNAYGNISVASKSLGASRSNVYAWIKDYDLKDVIQKGRDKAIDFAENKLMKKINEGDTACLIFFLKTQGRKRGYTEKQEIDINANMKKLPEWLDAE